MRKAFRSLLLMLWVIATGCTVLGPHLDFPPTTATLMATNQVLVKTPTITTKAPLPTVAPAYQQNVISPQLINICPENQEVPVGKIGFSKELHLLLLPDTVEGYPQIPGSPSSLSSENQSPIIIFNDALYEYSVSPDHKWIIFSRPGVDKKYPILWISSLDGEKQWPIIELGGKGYAGYASWVSEQEIFIIGSPNENEISVLNSWEYMPFMAVNPFTLEKRQLTYLAHSQEDELVYYGTANVYKHPFGMYGRLNRVDFFYNYEENKALPAFSWLETVDPFDMQFIKPIWAYGEGKFAVTITRPDGIDLAFNLSFQSAKEIKHYEDVMKRIIFPERLLPASVLGIVPGKELIALQRLDFFNSSQGKNWFYILDYNNQIVYDYCFDLKDPVKRVKFSPDGKFVAFSLENFSENVEQDQHYISILNLENGAIMYLDGYTVIDWGITP